MRTQSTTAFADQVIHRRVHRGALGQREAEQGDARGEAEHDEQQRRRAAAHGLKDLAGAEVARPPVEDRRAEDVVEDLVVQPAPRPSRPRRGAGSAPSLGQAGRAGRDLVLVEAGVVARSPARERSSCPRASRGSGRSSAATSRSPGGRWAARRRDASARSARSGRADRASRSAGRRACPPFLLPEPRHDELQVRRLDAPLLVRVVRRAPRRARHADDDRLPASSSSSSALDELGLDARRRILRRVSSLYLRHRLHDRVACASRSRWPHAQVVVEQRRDPALEAVEPRERVLADRDQEVGPQVGRASARGELARERPFAVLPGVIEEVLLELVQDDEHVRPEHAVHVGEQVAQRTVRRRRGRRPGRAAVDGALDRASDPFDGIVAPGDVAVASPESGRRRRRVGRSAALDVLRRQLVQLACDPGAEQRALADAALAVQERQARRP